MIASSQLERIAQQHSVIRPNTSPTPTGMFADLRKPGARKTSNGVNSFGLNNSSSNNSKMMRPLPPAKTMLNNQSSSMMMGGSGMGMGFSMMISGNKTGEEKSVSLVEKREAAERKPAAERKIRESKPVVSKPEVDHRDRLIKKLELELKRANATIVKMTSEADTLKSKVSTLEGSLSKQEKENGRLKSLVADLTGSNETKDQEIANLTAALKRHEEGASSQGAESRRLTQELDVMATKQSAAEAKWIKERAAWEQEKSALLDEVSAAQQEAKDAKAKVADGQSNLNKRQDLVEMERQSARDRENALQSEVRRTKKLLDESEKKLLEWKETVESCNAYILNICQPSFSVVKDENLTPVTPGVNTPEGGGFVLVPLPLLLQGYGLLPGNLKQQIAQDYEKTKGSEASSSDVAAAASSVASSTPIGQHAAPGSRGGNRPYSLPSQRR